MTIKNNVFTIDHPYEVEASENSKVEYTFEDAVEKTGFGRYNICIIFIGGLAILGVLTESLGTAMVVPLATCDFELTSRRIGFLTTMTLLGILLTAQFWGFMGDTKGRRVMILPAFLSVITTFASSIVTNFYGLLLFRFLTGVLIGATAAICYAYVSEFHGTKYRQNALAWTSSFVALSYVIIPGVAWILLPMEWSFDIPFINVTYTPWRLMLFLCSVPSLACALLALCFPESPRFLLHNDKMDEALDVLSHMYAVNKGKPQSTFPVKNLAMTETMARSTSIFFVTAWNQTVPIFQKPYLGKTLLMCFLQFGCFFSSLGFYNWLPQILLDLYETGLSQNSETVCDMIEEKNALLMNGTSLAFAPDCRPTHNQILMYQSSFAFGCISYFFYSLVAGLIQFVGNKLILLLLLGLSGTAGIFLHYVSEPWLILTFLGIFIQSMITVGVVNTFTPDMYPTKYRAMAISISFMFGRIGGVVGSNFAAYLLKIDCHSTFNIYGGLLLVCGAFALLLPRKT